SQFKYFGQFLVVQMGSDHAETSCIVRRSMADLELFRNHVNMQPAAVRTGHNPFRAPHDAAVVVRGELIQNRAQLLFGIFMRRLFTPAGKYFIRMVVMMVVIMVMLMIVVMVMMMLMVVIMVVIMMML